MSTLSFSFLPWLQPFLYAFSGVLPLFISVKRAWSIAKGISTFILIVPLTSLLLSLVYQPTNVGRVDYIGMIMALLIALLGWIILRYSQNYLQGEPKLSRFITALMLTLASVSIVAITDHLAILALAWTLISLSLHHLLTFYPARRAAQIVAHKKFLVSRLADVFMICAVVLILIFAKTLHISQIANGLSDTSELSDGLNTAMAFIALVAILKSAQLPFHGWLIQVMEAPTPVSALLHAGVVNLGGFVLIRLAPLLSASPIAQTLLVVVGSLTSVLAGLVMMTRISIKVRLAWSTCSQMGFMLLECGLGLYDLAFLHLIAHSFYKAYAFLSAGDAVLDTRRLKMLPASGYSNFSFALFNRLIAMPISIGIVLLSLSAWKLVVPTLALQPVVVLLIGLGLATQLWREEDRASGLFRGVIGIVLLTQIYFAWHLTFRSLMAAPEISTSIALSSWVAVCFISLYVAQVWLIAFPQGRLSTALYPWAYYGFYLDESFTRLTFKIWPVGLSKRSIRTSANLNLLGKQK